MMFYLYSIFAMANRASRRLLIPMLFQIGLLLFIAGVGFAGKGPPSADSIYNFASHSYEQGDYMTAMLEFKRFIFFYPEDRRVSEAAFKIGMAHFHENRFAKAIDAFNTVAKKYPGSPYATEAAFMLSRCHFKLNDPAAAFARLKQIAGRATEKKIRDRACYRIGWLHLKNGNLGDARRAFETISPENRDHYQIEKLLEELGQPRDIAHKNPVLAGLYAIFPGGGYLYTGRYRDALTAFVINTGMAAAAWESFDNELPALGAGISAVGLGFYSGSIYGGVNAAHKYNRRAYDDFIKSLEIRTDSNFSFHIKPTPKSVLFSFEYDF